MAKSPRASRRRFHYIYKTTCTVTGRYYIGMHSTDNLNDGYAGSGQRLWHSINKHGRDNHVCEILEFLPDRELLKKRERVIVDETTIAHPDCMNLRVGGEGGGSTDHLNRPEIRAKSESTMREILVDPVRRSKHSRAIRRGLNRYRRENPDRSVFNPMAGNRHSDESKRKMSDAKKGDKCVWYGSKWVSKGGGSKRIRNNDLESHLADGWSLGRTS